MIDNERIEKLKQRFKSFEIFKKKNSFEIYQNEKISSSSSSSSTSIESLDQSILFLSKGKFYKKSFNWIKIGKGECEIIQNNQSGSIFARIVFFSSIKIKFRRNISSILDFKKSFN